MRDTLFEAGKVRFDRGGRLGWGAWRFRDLGRRRLVGQHAELVEVAGQRRGFAGSFLTRDAFERREERFLGSRAGLFHDPGSLGKRAEELGECLGRFFGFNRARDRLDGRLDPGRRLRQVQEWDIGFTGGRFLGGSGRCLARGWLEVLGERRSFPRELGESLGFLERGLG